MSQFINSSQIEKKNSDIKPIQFIVLVWTIACMVIQAAAGPMFHVQRGPVNVHSLKISEYFLIVHSSWTALINLSTYISISTVRN